MPELSLKRYLKKRYLSKRMTSFRNLRRLIGERVTLLNRQCQLKKESLAGQGSKPKNVSQSEQKDIYSFLSKDFIAG